ncbi:MAG: hypothetical protein HC887_11695 [Desulfobacteraceae bacterium]|nr:hypothetical protein [Desulfobacteraceae bacterium]
MDLRDRLGAIGPKRILAIDGGGIRSLISLGFWEQIETLLRERHNNPNLRLYEYFDLIGGTSTGAVLAAGLAVGMDFYPAAFGLYFRYLQKLRTSISTI